MNVFITGGTGGIGKALAERYIAAGHTVGICGGSASDFQRTFQTPPPTLYFYHLDVTDRQASIDIISQFCHGQLDVLIAAAGINDGAPVKGRPLDFDRAEKIYQVNLLGTLHSVEAALANMLPHGHGRIAILSSAAAIAGYPQTPAYCSAKAALVTLSESLSLRYADRGISASCLLPGYIDTPLARATHPDFAENAIRDQCRQRGRHHHPCDPQKNFIPHFPMASALGQPFNTAASASTVPVFMQME